MNNPHIVIGVPSAKPLEQHHFTSKEHATNRVTPSQLDGAPDHHHRAMTANARNNATHPPHSRNTTTSLPLPIQPQNSAPAQTGANLLRHCTAGPPLSESQVIAISDVVGSLKELVLLIHAAQAGDGESEKKLVDALGFEAASDVVAFFGDEWEVE